MKCPFCRETVTEVYNTRNTKFATQIWRRRRCQACNQAFTTYEAPDLGFLSVIKRNNKKAQPYSRAKLYSSLYGAFEATSSKKTIIDAVTDTIEAKILDQQQRVLKSRDIAKIVLVTLKHFDATAFLRYLSYQPELMNNAEFKRELKKYK